MGFRLHRKRLLTPSHTLATVYWFNDGADANWATHTDNWWSDALHTTPLGAAPIAADDVVTVGDPGTGPEVDLDAWTEPASIDASATGITFTSAAATALGIAVTGDCTFNGDAESDAVTGDCTFNDTSSNGGAITGDATFNDTARAAADVSGTATFNDTAYNDATISGDAVFHDTSHNDATVSGTATFNDSSYNQGAVGNGATFNHQSQNRAQITGGVTFPGYGINGSAILGMP